MTLKMKKILCLALVVVMTATCFSACGSGSGTIEHNDEGLVDMTDDEITLTYMTWLNLAVSAEMCNLFHEKYNNIEVQFIETTTGDVAQTIADMHAAKNSPDVFWYVSEIDTPITNAYWQDMTTYFEADDDNKNLIKGIVEYNIGYFGTDYKWATPCAWFPDVAWVNKQFFEDNSLTMPSMDWTWEEFEDVIASATMGSANGMYGSAQSFGLVCNGGCAPVTWYCFAADDNCIAEFGWDGSKFNMYYWAEGLNKEREYLVNNWMLDASGFYQYANVTDETSELGITMFQNYGKAVYAQDAGYVAVYTSHWYTYQAYWNDMDQGYLDNGIIWVPYIQPHTESTTGKTNMSTMDMGGISQWCDNPREAYELMKWQIWSNEGWLEKCTLYSTLETDTYTNKEIRAGQQDLPITLDDDVWAAVRALEWYPQEGDEWGREEYFDYIFDAFKDKYWTGLGATIIPGFDTWVNNNYWGLGDACTEYYTLRDGGDAHDLVDDLEVTGYSYYEARYAEIIDYVTSLYGSN